MNPEQVPTANVLISTEESILQEVVDNLGMKGATLFGAVKKLPEADQAGILLFNNINNPNFLSFEHQFNLPETKAVLRFIDPKGEFESSFYSTGSIFRALVSTSKKVREAKKAEDRKAAKSLDLPGLTKKELASLVRGNLEKFLYVAYGTGNSSGDWSSIHKMKIQRVNFTSDGAREFTLVMVDVTKPLSRVGNTVLLKDRIDINTLGNTLAVRGYSDRIRYELTAFGGQVYGDGDGKYFPIDYHLLIVDMLIDYVRKASGGANVICLLPDLNTLLEDYVRGVDEAYAGNKSSGQNITALIKSVDEVLAGLSINHVRRGDIRLGLDPPGDRPLPTGLRSFYDAVQTENRRTDNNNYWVNGMWYAKLEAESTDGLPNFMAPIVEMIKSINVYASARPANYPISMAYFTESNTSLLNFWGNEDNRNKFTFNGLKPFDPTAPTIVMGHDAMLSVLLFPKEAKSPIPLRYIHPINSKDLDDTYKKNISLNYTLKKQTRTFGAKNQVPDIFGYKENLSQEALDIIESEQIPVFRHNTSNPNVLSVEIDDQSAAYAQVLRSGYQKQVWRTAVNLGAAGKAGVRVSDYPISDVSSMNAAIQTSLYSEHGPELKDKDIINDIVQRTDAKFRYDNKIKTNVQIAKIVKDYIEKLRSDEELTLKISQRVNANPGELIVNMANELSKKTVRVTLQSLPMFFISSKTEYLNSPIVLFSQDAPMMNQVYPNRTRFNNYLTGVYSILGYAHTISENEASSKFVLAKRNFDPVGTGQGGGDEGRGEEIPGGDEMTYEYKIREFLESSPETVEVLTEDLEPVEDKLFVTPEEPKEEAPEVIEVPITSEILDPPKPPVTNEKTPEYEEIVTGPAEFNEALDLGYENPLLVNPLDSGGPRVKEILEAGWYDFGDGLEWFNGGPTPQKFYDNQQEREE